MEVASSSLVTRSIKNKDHPSGWSLFFIPRGDDGSKIKSNLPGAGWRPVLKLVDPLSFLCAEQRKDANEPRHRVGASSISFAPARKGQVSFIPLRLLSKSNPLALGFDLVLFLLTPYPSPRCKHQSAHSVASPLQIEPTSLGFDLA